jgi:hypothetical protein
MHADAAGRPPLRGRGLGAEGRGDGDRGVARRHGTMPLDGDAPRAPRRLGNERKFFARASGAGPFVSSGISFVCLATFGSRDR